MKHLPIAIIAASAISMGVAAVAISQSAPKTAQAQQVQAAPAAADPHAAHRAAAAQPVAAKPNTARTNVVLSEALLTDQTGRSARLSSDFLKDRVVVFDFIFTTCTTICPLSTTLLTATKEQLKDVDPNAYVFVSVSIDPNTDTPARMAAFADSRGADWTFLTGEKRIVDKVLKDLGSYSTNPSDHAAMLVIGDASTGDFIRAFGLPNPDFVAAEVRSRVAARAGAHHHHQGH